MTPAMRCPPGHQQNPVDHAPDCNLRLGQAVVARAAVDIRVAVCVLRQPVPRLLQEARLALGRGKAHTVGVEPLAGGERLRDVALVQLNPQVGGVEEVAPHRHVTDQGVPGVELLHNVQNLTCPHHASAPWESRILPVSVMDTARHLVQGVPQRNNLPSLGTADCPVVRRATEELLCVGVEPRRLGVPYLGVRCVPTPQVPRVDRQGLFQGHVQLGCFRNWVDPHRFGANGLAPQLVVARVRVVAAVDHAAEIPVLCRVPEDLPHLRHVLETVHCQHAAGDVGALAGQHAFRKQLDALEQGDVLQVPAVVAVAVGVGGPAQHAAQGGVLRHAVDPRDAGGPLHHLVCQVLRQDVAPTRHVGGASDDPEVTLLDVPLVQRDVEPDVVVTLDVGQPLRTAPIKARLGHALELRQQPVHKHKRVIICLHGVFSAHASCILKKLEDLWGERVVGLCCVEKLEVAVLVGLLLQLFLAAVGQNKHRTPCGAFGYGQPLPCAARRLALNGGLAGAEHPNQQRQLAVPVF
mmetsp:Transcript_29988/g.75556  ORF Transcript_29988/g.75556 Transcript_29988/m.75556 type:complete len:522 (-) Transcript_29988:803-2368(-)